MPLQHFRSSLSFRLVCIVLLVASGTTILFGGAEAWYEFHQEERRLATAIERTVRIIRKAAFQAVFEIDTGLAEEIVKGLVEHEYIQSAVLRDDMDAILAAAESPPPPDFLLFHSFPIQPERRIFLLRERPSSPVLGTLIIQANHEVARRNFLRNTAYRMGTGALQFLIISLVLIFFCHRSIISPLLSIVHQLEEVDADAPGNTRIETRPSLKTTAIGLLAAGINRMLAQITDYLNRRKETEQQLRESDTRYALVVKGANDGIWDWDMLTDEVYFSDRYKGIIGFAPNEIRADVNEWKDRIHPEDIDRVLAENQKVIDGRADFFEVEYRMRHKNGEYRWILRRGTGLQDENGRIVRMAGTHTDITARKKTEHALRKAEDRYRTIFQNSPMGIFRSAFTGRLLDMNPAMARIFGYADVAEMASMVRHTGRDLYPEEEDLQKVLDRLMEQPDSLALDVVFRKKDGTLFSARMNLSLTHDSEGKPAFIDGALEDITRRKEQEEALRASEERYRRLFTEMQEGFAVHEMIFDEEGDPVDYQFLAVNPAFERLTGFPASRTVNRTLRELIPTASPEWFHICADVAGGNKPVQMVYPLLQDSQLFHFRLFSTLPGQFAAIFSDVTKEKEIENRLRQSEERYRAIFNATTDAIAIHDMETLSFVDVNRAFLDLFGYERDEVMQLHPIDISSNQPPYSSKDAAIIMKRVMGGETVTYEWQDRRRNGDLFWTEKTATRVSLGGMDRIMVIMRDISEKKRIQDMMVQTEKMMSVGGLAAGMAHEINNPLGIIMQLSQNMERRLTPSLKKNQTVASELGIDLEKLQVYLDQRGVLGYIESIRNAGERSASIVKSMLKFSRKSESNRSPCNLTHLIDNVLELAANDYDLKKKYDFRSIPIVRDDPDTLPLIECTETEISQVFLNIIKNAAQAIGETEPPVASPEIRIRTGVEGNFVRIEIEDNGPGMPADIRRRIFEPFFTTKAPGVGTGLGMSVSYFIITTNHSGRIAVDSPPDGGARFTIHLPLPAAYSRPEGDKA